MSFKKNNPGKMLMDAILCWEGRPMYEKEFRKYCGLGHELLLKVRKALIGAGLITYEVTPRGTIYRLTDQGRRMMQPDESLDHRVPPEYPHGPRPSWTRWATTSTSSASATAATSSASTASATSRTAITASAK